MRTLRRATNRREQGASAVEFALILTPLLLIVFGLVQYGMYFWAKQGASAAARDAAREAAVGKPADCATFRDNVRDSIGTFATDEIANPPVIKRTSRASTSTFRSSPSSTAASSVSTLSRGSTTFPLSRRPAHDEPGA